MAHRVAPPSLPIFPTVYSSQAMQEFIRILRLFFVQVTSALAEKVVQPTVVKSVQVTGFSYRVPDACNILIINPAGVLAAGTATLPYDPEDQQIVEITTSFAITAFTLSTAPDQSVWGWTNGSTLTAGAGLRYIYTAEDSVWNRIS